MPITVNIAMYKVVVNVNFHLSSAAHDSIVTITLVYDYSRRIFSTYINIFAEEEDTLHNFMNVIRCLECAYIRL